MLENKQILITGATGFVGYHLAKHLVENNTVFCLVRTSSDLTKLEKLPKVKFIVYDGNLNTLLNKLNDIKFDLIYHLASLFIAEHKPEQIDDLVNSNIKFPTQLLEVLTNNQKQVKLINAGTAWQNYDESNYNPVCLYAATKQSFEDVIKYYHEARGLSCITLRLYDTYGPEDERKKLMWLLNNLRQTGDSLDMSCGEQKLNLVHIYDVVNAFVLAGNKLLDKDNYHDSINEVYGVYTDHEYSLKEVVSIFEKINNCKLNINWGKKLYREREVMKPFYYYKLLTSWSEKIHLSEGIRNLAL